MPFTVLSPPERWFACLLGLTLALVLALGFLPTTQALYHWLSSPWGERFPEGAQAIELAAFPCLAGAFALSLWPRHRPAPGNAQALWLSAIVPVAVAFCYGRFNHGPSLLSLWHNPAARSSLAWYFLSAPVGEECLFRGWVYEIGERLWPGRFFTATNPLPVAVWLAAGGFALWHLQNLAVESTASVLFQVLYTALTGLWLGYLRWQSGRLFPSILGHIALNFAANFA